MSISWCLALLLLVASIFRGIPAAATTADQVCTGDPCVLSGTVNVTPGSVLDFQTRAFRITRSGALVVGEVALSLVLLVGASLMIRALIAIGPELGRMFLPEAAIHVLMTATEFVDELDDPKLDDHLRNLIRHALHNMGAWAAKHSLQIDRVQGLHKMGAWVGISPGVSREQALEVEGCLLTRPDAAHDPKWGFPWQCGCEDCVRALVLAARGGQPHR